MTKISTGYFLLKYFIRALKMLSFAFVFGNVCYDLFFGKRFLILQGANLAMLTTFTIIMFLSGLTNMIFILVENKFNKDIKYNIYKYTMFFKIFAGLFITPILEKIVNIFTSDEMKIEDVALKIRFVLIFISFLLGPFQRYFREYYMEKEENLESYKLLY
jgi:hypothetical protein